MTATYEKIATNTVSGGSTSSISFTSISATYTDLVVISNGGLANGGGYAIGFNGDTASNYSRTFLKGDGSTASSGRTSNAYPLFVTSDGANQTNIWNIMNYSNATTYKTFLTRGNGASDNTIAFACLWRSTSAINRLDIICSSTTFTSGFTATLYGIKAE